MSCCPGRVYGSCEGGLSSVRTEDYAPVTYSNTPVSPIVSLPLSSSGGVYITLPHAAVLQATFSGTITGRGENLGDVGFQLGCYNVLGGLYSESLGTYYPYQTIVGGESAAVSVTFAWPLCAGTYVINVYLNQKELGTYTELTASGELAIVMTKK